MATISPILWGSDIGTYSLARYFHEAYGVRSQAVTRQGRGPINDSSIVTPVLLGEDAETDDIIATIAQLAAEARAHGLEPVVTANSDVQVAHLQASRELLTDATLLIPDAADVARVSDKALLPDLAARAGLRSPREVLVGPGDAWVEEARELDPEFVVKPAVSAEYEQIPGLMKLYRATDLDDARRIVGVIRDTGFTSELLLQELIPGDDTHNYVATLYRDRSGVVTVSATMRMLLALRRAKLLGNAALGLVAPYPQISEPAAAVLADADYHGFATLDIKVHARTGERYLLDINPRIGRSNHFIGIGGVNPVVAAVDDAHGEPHAPEVAEGRGIYRIVPLQLLGRYVKDHAVRAEVDAARREGGASHPLDYRADRNLKREFYRRAASVNHVRSFLRDYPTPNDYGF